MTETYLVVRTNQVAAMRAGRRRATTATVRGVAAWTAFPEDRIGRGVRAALPDWRPRPASRRSRYYGCLCSERLRERHTERRRLAASCQFIAARLCRRRLCSLWSIIGVVVRCRGTVIDISGTWWTTFERVCWFRPVLLERDTLAP